MKNSFLIALLSLAIAGIFSCTKTEPVRPQNYTPTERTIATDLMSMSFESRTDENGTVYLQADRNLDGISAAEINSQHVFVYAISSVGGRTHQLMPFSIHTDDANFSINANLNNGSVSVRIDTDAQNQGIDAAQFQGMQIQVLFVSAEDYNRLQVDWSDYFAVFAALRSLPLPRVQLESDSQANSNH